MSIGSGVLLPGVVEIPTFPILRPLAYTTGLGYRPTCDIKTATGVSGDIRNSFWPKFQQWSRNVGSSKPSNEGLNDIRENVFVCGSLAAKMHNNRTALHESPEVEKASDVFVTHYVYVKCLGRVLQ